MVELEHGHTRNDNLFSNMEIRDRSRRKVGGLCGNARIPWTRYCGFVIVPASDPKDRFGERQPRRTAQS